MKNLVIGLVLYTAAVFGLAAIAVGQTTDHQDKREPQLPVVAQFAEITSRNLFHRPFSTEYGITDTWQLTMESNAASSLTRGGEIVSGAVDLMVGTRYSWMNVGRSNFHVAAGLDVGLPVGTLNGLGAGEFAYEPYMMVARDFPRLSNLQLYSQFGVTLAQPVNVEDSDRVMSKGVKWNSGFSFDYRKASFTTEMNLENADGESDLYFTPGVVWRLRRNLELGMGVSIGGRMDADKFRTIVKFTYEF